MRDLGARSRKRAAGAAAAAVVVALFTFGAIARSGAAVDTNAPVLASLAMTPATVDTSSAPAVVTITARLTDETSPSIGGTAPLSRVILTGPHGQQQAIAYLSQAQRISGTPADGVYRSTATIAWHSEPGHWTASAVLVDISGNTRTLRAPDLAAAGFPSGIDQAAGGDTTAPQLVSLNVAPASVDTSLSPATITVSVHAVDDLSGVSDGVGVAASQVVLRGPSGAHHARATLSVDHRTSGDALDATFVVAVGLPRWSEQGVWTVESVTLVDQVGNQRVLTAPGVTFTQTGIGDTAPPQIRSFGLSTTNVDVRIGSAPIVMRGRIVDDLSGAADGVTASATSVVFMSPSGRQRMTVTFGAAQRVGGNAIDGNYSMTATVPAHAEPGAWTMTDAWPSDQAGNVGHLGATDWAAKTFPGTFTVVSDSPPDTGPTVPAGSTVATDPTSVSVFTTTSTLGPDSTTTATTVVDGSSTTSLADASSTTVPDDSTTLPGDATSTTVEGDPSSTSVPDVTTTVTTVAGASTSTTTTDVASTTTVAPRPTSTTRPRPTTTTVPVHATGDGPPRARSASGYWFATSFGQVIGFGGAQRTSVAGTGVGWGDRAVGIASTPTGRGYWVATDNGDVRAVGDARSYGSMAGHALSKPIVGVAATPTGHGYWLVATDGGIFGFGDAHFYGSTGALHLNQPIVGMTATPSGHGYWFVAADGGLFSYGDARFYGSMGATPLNQPIVGVTSAPSGHGYWMVARDGGIFGFGAAHFYGSTGSIRLNQPIVGMAASPTARGYWFVAADGGVFGFGDAHFYGSFSNPAARVVGMAVRAA